MSMNGTVALASTNSVAEEPTPASTWLAIAGSPISDDLLEWPADLFALTDVILGRSEAYRFVFSAPSGLEWICNKSLPSVTTWKTSSNAIVHAPTSS